MTELSKKLTVFSIMNAEISHAIRTVDKSLGFLYFLDVLSPMF